MEKRNFNIDKNLKLVVVRYFIATEDGQQSIHAYPCLIQEGVFHWSEDNIGDSVPNKDNTRIYSGLESYSTLNDSYDEDFADEIPDSIKDVNELVDYILDGWTESVYEEGYDVVDSEFYVDLWKDGKLVFQKKLQIR